MAGLIVAVIRRANTDSNLLDKGNHRHLGYIVAVIGVRGVVYIIPMTKGAHLGYIVAVGRVVSSLEACHTIVPRRGHQRYSLYAQFESLGVEGLQLRQRHTEKSKKTKRGVFICEWSMYQLCVRMRMCERSRMYEGVWCVTVLHLYSGPP